MLAALRNFTLVAIGLLLGIGLATGNLGSWWDSATATAAGLVGQEVPGEGNTPMEIAQSYEPSARSLTASISAYDYTTLQAAASGGTVTARLYQSAQELEDLADGVTITSIVYPSDGCVEGNYCYVLVEGQLRRARTVYGVDSTAWYGIYGFAPDGSLVAFNEWKRNPRAGTPTEFDNMLQRDIDRKSAVEAPR